MKQIASIWLTTLEQPRLEYAHELSQLQRTLAAVSVASLLPQCSEKSFRVAQCRCTQAFVHRVRKARLGFEHAHESFACRAVRRVAAERVSQQWLGTCKVAGDDKPSGERTVVDRDARLESRGNFQFLEPAPPLAEHAEHDAEESSTF